MRDGEPALVKIIRKRIALPQAFPVDELVK
jgi:hypothetical protein